MGRTAEQVTSTTKRIGGSVMRAAKRALRRARRRAESKLLDECPVARRAHKRGWAD